MFERINTILKPKGLALHIRDNQEGYGFASIDSLGFFLYMKDEHSPLCVLSLLGHVSDLTSDTKLKVLTELLKANQYKNNQQNSRLSLSDDEKIWFSMAFSQIEQESSQFLIELDNFISLSKGMKQKVFDIIKESLDDSKAQSAIAENSLNNEDLAAMLGGGAILA